MEKQISIIGGDLRIVYLAKLLAEDGFVINSFALENAMQLKKINSIKQQSNLKSALQKSNVILSSIPLSADGVYINTPYSNEKISINELYQSLENKTLIAGNLKSDLHKTKVYDILKQEEYAILNAIATAEGAIGIAMNETNETISGSNILVMGFGRIGKILAKMLQGLGANVYCEARKNTDLAYIKAYSYIPIHLNNLDEHLQKFDIIINNIPTKILNSEKLNLVKKDVLIIDLASRPGGVDFNYAKEKGIKTIWALGLPGKVAPLSSAKYINQIINPIINNERGRKK